MFNDDKTLTQQSRVPLVNSGDIKSELNMIIKRYGIDAPDHLLEELTALHLDPPPWQPWTN